MRLLPTDLLLKEMVTAFLWAATFAIILAVSAAHFMPVICCFIHLTFLIIAGIQFTLHFAFGAATVLGL